MNITQDKILIKRTSKKFIDNLLLKNPSWKILDIGCGYTAHNNATVICDVQDLSDFYKGKNFIKLESIDKDINNLINLKYLQTLKGLQRIQKILVKITL